MVNMCPNRQILSVYHDGELPSPWKEKMETHLAQCAECRNRLEQYRSFSLSAAGQEEPDARIEAVKDRVWQKLAFAGANGVRARARESLWRRSIVIPLPVAAAAAALLVLVFTVALVNRPAPVTVPQEIIAANGIVQDLQGISPVSDVRGVLQYLSNEDDVVILRLPESKSFMSYGEPIYVRAEDYSRSTRPR
jgi:anti-sigma factor RsiW